VNGQGPVPTDDPVHPHKLLRAAICLFIGMYAVLGIGLDWHSGTWRGDLLILLLAVVLPLVLAALRHWRRWRT
jgi:hypothetical protein